MTLYAIFHKPSGTFFPHIRQGSSYYDFAEPFYRTKHKHKDFPRIFHNRQFAARYITEYCKGIRDVDRVGRQTEVHYKPQTGRNPTDFKIMVVTLLFKDEDGKEIKE